MGQAGRRRQDDGAHVEAGREQRVQRRHREGAAQPEEDDPR
jgi:hypothetical protein